jgi:hypothetical protein
LATKTFTAGEVLTASDTNAYLNNYRADLVSPSELTVISAVAATGTVTVDIADTSVTYLTSDATANFTVNLRGNSSTTASSYIQVDEAVTHVLLNTNGVTAYYPTAFQVDGTAVTPIFQGGAAFSAGNASSVDAYSFTIIKTDSTPTYKVLASQTQFK